MGRWTKRGLRVLFVGVVGVAALLSAASLKANRRMASIRTEFDQLNAARHSETRGAANSPKAPSAAVHAAEANGNPRPAMGALFEKLPPVNNRADMLLLFWKPYSTFTEADWAQARTSLQRYASYLGEPRALLRNSQHAALSGVSKDSIRDVIVLDRVSGRSRLGPVSLGQGDAAIGISPADHLVRGLDRPRGHDGGSGDDVTWTGQKKNAVSPKARMEHAKA